MVDRPRRTIQEQEAELERRKKKTAIWDIRPVRDAVMLHYVMNVLYMHFLKEHQLRADWQPNLLLSSRRYLGSLPAAQVQLIAGGAATEANELFGPVLGNLMGMDVRHTVVAFAEVVLKLVDQNRYRFSDDALVLQSLAIQSEAVDEQFSDWNYVRDKVNYLFAGFMKQIDASPYFRTEAELEGVAHEVLH